MNLENTLQEIHRQADNMAFSWYIRKGYVPPVLKKIMDTAAQCKQILQELQYKAVAFDFVDAIAAGKTLLVGEGNLSFTLSLTKKNRIKPENLTATTIENKNDLAPGALENAQKIQCTGAFVLFGVDATKLSDVFGAQKFDNIIFQFPHAGSRAPVEGHNPNFILVRDFLKSAAYQLVRSGKVLISAVDNPHYRGAFQFDKAAEAAGFSAPDVYPFDPEEFSGYTHTMTHQDGSALDNHETFSTWVFKLKP